MEASISNFSPICIVVRGKPRKKTEKEQSEKLEDVQERLVSEKTRRVFQSELVVASGL